jgi:hypothetical protein
MHRSITEVGLARNRAPAAVGIAMGFDESRGSYARTNPMINADFRTDWTEFLKTAMAACNLEYALSHTLEENTDRYLNAKRRIPRRTGRAIHESKELSVPPQYAADYSALRKLIGEGGDLKPYLSRDIERRRADKNDRILNAWGIQHLHFRAKGTGDLLLVKITEAEVFVIQTLPHSRDLWVNTALLQILHDNWPALVNGKCSGIESESLTATERLSLRDRNVNVAVGMSDGTVYISPGGGLMASGQCFSDLVDGDKIFAELSHWQKLVEDNEVNFRTALNLSPPEELSIKMAFDNDGHGCWLYEPTNHARLLLTLQQ